MKQHEYTYILLIVTSSGESRYVKAYATTDERHNRLLERYTNGEKSHFCFED